MPHALDRRTFLATIGSTALLSRTAYSQTLAAPERELMIPVEGGRIYARVNGDLQGKLPPLLMIHGGPGVTHSLFLPFLALSADRAVILYDQLDSGRSDRPNDPKNWRVERFVDEVGAIRQALNLQRLHVYGHSWGGTIALEYAAKRPPGLAGTILQGPLISTRSWLAGTRALRKTLPAPVQALMDRCETPEPPPLAQCQAADQEFYDRFVQRLPYPPAMQAYDRSVTLPINEKIYGAMWGRTEFTSTGTLRTYDGEPQLAKLDGPRTLFIVGQHDEAVPEIVSAFAARVPGSEFAVIPGAGHIISVDRPNELIGLVSAWLRRIDAMP